MMQAPGTDMDLRRLFPGLSACPPQVDVVDVATHSAEVVPGGLFIACAGTREHGLRFVNDAVRHGARAVAWEPGAGVSAPALPGDVVGVPVPGLQARIGEIANEFFAHPSAALSVTGITGTNGKTTVAWLVVQALEKLGRRAGYMGTSGFGLGTVVTADALTTPGCINAHRRPARTRQPGRQPRRHGSVIPRAGPGACRRRCFPGGRLHQPDARSSRLPR